MSLEDDILREFLLESFENLSRLDLEMVELERDPGNLELLGSVFRTIHTIKGTCGFVGFSRLQALAHRTEDILNELREGRMRLDGRLTSLLLKAVDAIKRILNSIQADSTEGELFESEVLAELAGEPAKAAAPPLMPAQDTTPAPAPPKATAAVSDSALRVDVGLLDRLMNLVGELVLVRNQLNQFNTGRDDTALNTIRSASI
jgi:two-component system chemotaxis sensor kinase CheA